MAARTVLTSKDLEKIVELYDSGTLSKSAIAKEYSIGLPRLHKEVKNYKAKIEKLAEQKRKKKGTPLTTDEVALILELYTEDHWSMNKIARHIQRSPGAVRTALVKNNIPIRTLGKTIKPTIVGDKTSNLNVGDKIYSYKYKMYGFVKKVNKDSILLWLESDNHAFFAYQRRSDIAKI